MYMLQHKVPYKNELDEKLVVFPGRNEESERHTLKFEPSKK